MIQWIYDPETGTLTDERVYTINPDGTHTQVTDSALASEVESQGTQVSSQRNGGSSGSSSSLAKASGKVAAQAATAPASISVYLLDVVNLYQFDPATNKVTRTLSLIAPPLTGSPTRFKVTSDGKFAVVTNHMNNLPSSVAIVDLTSFTVAANIPLASNTDLNGIAITPDDKFAYVVGQPLLSGPCTVTVIDLTARRIATTISLPDDQYLTNIAMTPDGAEAYLSSCCSNAFSIPVIDIPSNTISMRVSMQYYSTQTGLLPSVPGGYLAMHPDGTRLYVAPQDGSPVRVLDTITKTITKLIQIPQGATPWFGTDPHFTPDGRLLFILNAPNAISVIDTSSDTLSTTLPLNPILANAPPGGVRIGFFFVPGA